MGKTLSKVVPEGVCGRTFFWGALPSILFLFTVGVSFFSPSVLSAYLPFFALVGGLVCLRWKSVGLGGCFLALTLLVVGLYKEIPTDQRLWQTGLIFSLAIDFFILLLAIEEIESGMKKVMETSRQQATELNQSQLELQQSTTEWRALQKSLEEEIEQLKEEAEQRIIEKQQTQKRIELVQSEIELLTSQKAYFVAEAKKGQQRGKEQTVALQAELERLKVKQEAAAKEEWARQNAAIQADLENQKAAANEELANQRAAVQAELEDQKAAQEKVLQEKLEQLKAAQEEAPCSCTVEQRAPADQRKLEGMLNQLRKQFDEKSRILSQTRQDLFATESKLLALKHEQDLLSLSPNREEEKCYETALHALVAEMTSLEEERATLEELVSHALSQ